MQKTGNIRDSQFACPNAYHVPFLSADVNLTGFAEANVFNI